MSSFKPELYSFTDNLSSTRPLDRLFMHYLVWNWSFEFGYWRRITWTSSQNIDTLIYIDS